MSVNYIKLKVFDTCDFHMTDVEAKVVIEGVRTKGRSSSFTEASIPKPTMVIDHSVMTALLDHSLSDAHFVCGGFLGGRYFREKGICHISHFVPARR